MLTSMKLMLDWLVTILLLFLVSACIGYLIGSSVDSICHAIRLKRTA